MTKIAIFVEGKTERKFIKRLIYKRYGSVAAILVREMVLRGKDTYFQPVGVVREQGIDCLFLIVEAPEYSKMISMVADNAENMVGNRGYALVIGLRDLIPNRREEKVAVINGINRLLNGLSVRSNISVIIAVMETEAWFLYDYELFQRIGSQLSASFIQENLNIDLTNDDPELEYDHPAYIIDNIMKLIELRYRKHEDEIDTIAGNINFNNMFACTGKIDSFTRFVSELDKCGVLC